MSQTPLPFARIYHERTKYDPETIHRDVPEIDWDRPPVPFKTYKLGTPIDLKPHIGDRDTPLSDLSRLLYCTYGVTARVPTLSGSDVYLRAAPSAGGLYPAEIYLVSRGNDALPPGLYNYQVRDHSLLRFWDSDPGDALQEACFGNSALDGAELILAVTAVFFRSAWRYQDRAYRRIHLDSGHLLGNLDLAGSLTHYRPHLIAGFNDDALNRLLYLDPSEEGAIAVAALHPHPSQRPPDAPTALPSATQTDYPDDLKSGTLLAYLHRASSIGDRLPTPETPTSSSGETLEDKYNFPFCTKVSVQSPPVDWGEDLGGLEATLLHRRSTRAYQGGASIDFDRFKALLNFTYQAQTNPQLADRPDYCDRQLIQTFIAVTAVNGLEDGCYYYAPHSQELRQTRFKNFRRELHFLCLGQDLGRDAAAVVFHTADLDRAVGRWGDRAYRYLHLDAGHFGQRLNLAAIHLGLGVSGIGGFFDDRVNDVLGIPTDEAVLYVTTLGQPRS